MPTLRDIRARIAGVRSTAKITSAMKMVAAAKMKRAQNAIESARPYVLKLEEILGNLLSSVSEDYTHPLMRKPEAVNNIALVVIGSDRGLCGSFNTNLFRSAIAYINNDLKAAHPNANVQLITVGRKACSFFKKEKYPIHAEYPGVFHQLEFSQAKRIVDSVKDEFVHGQFDQVILYFNAFVNILRQIPTGINLLPLVAKPDAGKFKANYIFEPSQKEILDALLPKFTDIQLWRTLLESNAAEQAAKMMAMDNATTNANDLIKHLEMAYNNARQAAITKEMLEIVSGAESLRSA
ncbi:MAG: ATP synthase F1 subunit gamma [Chloroflexota bacterium]